MASRQAQLLLLIASRAVFVTLLAASFLSIFTIIVPDYVAKRRYNATKYVTRNVDLVPFAPTLAICRYPGRKIRHESGSV